LAPKYITLGSNASALALAIFKVRTCGFGSRIAKRSS
jgi:hypothetical protein